MWTSVGGDVDILISLSLMIVRLQYPATLKMELHQWKAWWAFGSHKLKEKTEHSSVKLEVGKDQDLSDNIYQTRA